jgi:hypothetical protein
VTPPITISEHPDPYAKSHNGSRTVKREVRRTSLTEFVAVDGEGVTRPDGSHAYVLLAVGDQQVSNPDGLTWPEIVEFLWEQFNEQGTDKAYVGFFLGYDFSQWLKHLPEERARRLLTAEGRALRTRKPRPNGQVIPFPYPVQYGDWEFDILGNKRFKLRKIGAPKWMSICDAGPFFQKSFVSVINPDKWKDPVVSQEEYETILKGKAHRSDAILDSDMRKYNLLENEVLSRTMQRLDSGFRDLGIHLRPNQWFGPGQAAQAWLKDRAIPSSKLRETCPAPALVAAQASYYGGWFEIMMHGIVPGTSYEYDINSAYPYVISQLPCLEHGAWTRGKSTLPSGKTESGSTISLIYAKVTGSDPYIGSMLHRDVKGNISRPDKTEGWYWLDELNAAQDAGCVSSAEISDAWTYVPCECPPPFREVRDIYKRRKEVGKDTPLGIACKLVPNSLYGKFAQSVGNPKFGNPIYASRTTSGCRKLILNAIATHPNKTEDVLMVATDGVYFKTPHPALPVSGELGDWEMAEKEDMTLFKPGMYWDAKARAAIRAGEAPVFKARGVNAVAFGKSIPTVDRLFRHLRESLMDGEKLEISEWSVERTWYECPDRWPEANFPISFMLTTPVQALARGKWETAGEIITDRNGVHCSNPYLKRSRGYADGEWVTKTLFRRYIRSMPRQNDPYEPSYPYEKRFGMEDTFSEERTKMTIDGPLNFREIRGE